MRLPYHALQSLADLGILKDETALDQPAGKDLLTLKYHCAEFPQSQFYHEPRGRHERLAMQCPAQSLRQILITERLRQAYIHRTRYFLVVQEKDKGLRQVSSAWGSPPDRIL